MYIFVSIIIGDKIEIIPPLDRSIISKIKNTGPETIHVLQINFFSAVAFKKLKLKVGEQFSQFVPFACFPGNSITIYLHKIHEGSVDHSDNHR